MQGTTPPILISRGLFYSPQGTNYGRLKDLRHSLIGYVHFWDSSNFEWGGCDLPLDDENFKRWFPLIYPILSYPWILSWFVLHHVKALCCRGSWDRSSVHVFLLVASGFPWGFLPNILIMPVVSNSHIFHAVVAPLMWIVFWHSLRAISFMFNFFCS